MLTQKLEQLIWEGKASYKTWALGVGAASTIKVQKNSFICIVKFSFSPFLDTAEIAPFSVSKAAECSAHTVRFQAVGGSKQYYYNFRNSFNINVNAYGAGTFLPLPSQDAKDVDTYMMFDKDVRIDIWKLKAPKFWGGAAYLTLQPVANEVKPPVGYGTVIPVNRNVNLGAGDGLYIPPLKEYVDLPAYADYREQYYNNVSANTQLGAISASDQGPYQYPLINVGYVEIFQNPERIKF